MDSGTLLHDCLDAFNKLVMDLRTAGIKKDDETLACSLPFSLTSKYCDIENSMMYRKQPIKLEQVRQALNSCDVRMNFEEDKSDKTSGLFCNRLYQPTRKEKIEVQIKVLCEKNECGVLGLSQEGYIERNYPMSKSKEKASVSIVEKVHDSDDDCVLTTSCNSGVYDNKWDLELNCTLHMKFLRDETSR